MKNMTSSGNTGKDGESKTTALVNEKNPLELSPIIKCVLQYLNVEDLKNCRYLSKEWSSRALMQLKSRAKIVFRCWLRDVLDDIFQKTPARFYEDFSNTSSAIQFTAFEFRAEWKLTELKSFVQSHKNALNEFYLNLVSLYDDKNQKLKSFDISPFISDSPMTRPNTKRSTKLSVDSCLTDSQIVVPLSSLVHVKKLKLRRCQLILEDQIKPRPIELELSHVRFVRNGDSVANVCINNVFNFSRCKNIEIFVAGSMELDLSSNNALNLDYLYLERKMTLKNWRSCRWSIKELKLWTVPFVEKTEMQVKELHFSSSRVDVSLLPTSLETLVVFETRENDCFSSQSVNLPNLKYLSLNIKEHLSEMIPHFVYSPLVEMDLRGDKYLSREINFNSIPKSVKILKLRDVTVNVQEGDSPLNLDKLVLAEYSYSPNTMLRVLILTSSLFKTTELAIVGNCTEILEQVGVDFLGFLLLDKKCLDCNQRFYVGPFDWYRRLIFENSSFENSSFEISSFENSSFEISSFENSSFEISSFENSSFENSSFKNSPLIQYVDKEDVYYVFQNNMGKAVDWCEFREFVI